MKKIVKTKSGKIYQYPRKPENERRMSSSAQKVIRSCNVLDCGKTFVTDSPFMRTCPACHKRSDLAA